MRSLVLGSLTLACLAPCVAGSAWAQSPPPIKPGLWEVRSERELDGQKQQMPDMSERLKNLPPEARAQIEAMMKQRGVDMSGGGGGMKICLTKESLDQGRWQNHQGTCKTDFTSRSGSTWKWHTSCSQPVAETDGEATFTSAESYTVKTATTTNVQGAPRTTHMTMNSKWLGADCGDVKPVTPRP
jgi:hypothetical protein